ncbi:MAG: type IX secretion system outer membrane channel protein PorV [Chitinophagaceae bacterium]
MKFILPASFLTFLFSSLSGFVQAQISTDSLDGRVNTVNTAVPFLRISPDARSGAMGDVGIAISPDANSGFWDLAKIPFATTTAAASITYTPWLTELVNDVYLATLSGYKKINDNEAISGSLRYFSLGNIQFTDINGQDQGQFNPREFALDGGYARKLSDNWSMGLALRYIYSNLASGQTVDGQTFKAGQAVAGDISAFYTKDIDYAGGGSGNWSFGVAITNLGTKISYSSSAIYKNFLPTNLGIGGAYTIHIDQYNKFTIALDINKLLVPTPPLRSDTTAWANYENQGVVSGVFSSFVDAPGGFREEMQELMFSSGVEYTYNNIFSVRAGYYNENKNKGNRKYFTVGLGLKYNQFGMNFSYLVPSGSGIQRNPLSNTLRFSLLFDLGSHGK